MVELYSTHIKFVKSLYHENILNFLNAFFHIYGDDHTIFLLNSANITNHIY